MKLLVCDLDGTLYPKKSESSELQFQNNVKAVQKWVEKGNKFAVATARGLHHYSVLTEKLGLEVEFIGCNGAMVRLDTGEEILKEFPCSVFIDLCKFVKENNINASVATGIGDEWVWSGYEKYPRGVEVYDSLRDVISIADLDAIDPTLGTVRIQIFTPPENRDILKGMIIDRNYPVTVTTSDHDMVDIGPLESSKGISIMELCQKYGITENNLIVAGDSENDIPMFEITKHSYCINHAEPEVLMRASKVIESVAELIEMELEKEN